MINHILRGLSIFLLAAPMVGTAAAEAPGGVRSAEPRQGVIVLHGGQVLQGKIVRSGDLYHVMLPGGEIRVRATKVAYQCDSLEEAYRLRRANINAGNADEHVALARWCRRNGLLSAAARELADAMAANPNHPWIPHLERDLKAAMTPSRPQTDDPANPRTKVPSGEELDQMVRQMPAGSVEAFKASVQPLLINSCTTGGCHGPQSGDRFRLLRGHAGRAPSRRATQRNLHATMAMIDRERPEKSPLLLEAMRAHGTAETPALGTKDAIKFQQIVQWVYLVAQGNRQAKPAPKPANVGEPLIGQSGPGKRPAVMAAAWPEETLKAAAAGSSTDFPSSKQSSPNAATPGVDRPGVQRGAQIKRFVPADPFDPEIFNRRYHEDKGSK